MKEVYLAQADVLNHFIEVLIATGEVYRAKVVAIQMLNKAHQIKSDIVTVSEARFETMTSLQAVDICFRQFWLLSAA